MYSPGDQGGVGVSRHVGHHLQLLRLEDSLLAGVPPDPVAGAVVHGVEQALLQCSPLQVEVRSEELLRQLSNAIKNQLGQQVISYPKLVHYDTMAPT